MNVVTFNQFRRLIKTCFLNTKMIVRWKKKKMKMDSNMNELKNSIKMHA